MPHIGRQANRGNGVSVALTSIMATADLAAFCAVVEIVDQDQIIHIDGMALVVAYHDNADLAGFDIVDPFALAVRIID